MDIKLKNNTCVCCKKEFSDKNVFTDAGWRETEISQMCEACFDSITLSSEDDEIHE